MDIGLKQEALVDAPTENAMVPADSNDALTELNALSFCLAASCASS